MCILSFLPTSTVLISGCNADKVSGDLKNLPYLFFTSFVMPLLLKHVRFRVRRNVRPTLQVWCRR